MAYRFQPAEPIADNARRIAAESLEESIALIDSPVVDRVETVHEVRKHCKKLRALIRLVDPGPSEPMMAEICVFRDVARSLSRMREAHIWSAALEDLVAGTKGDLDGDGLTIVKRRLLEARDRVERVEVDLERVLLRARDEFETARSRAAGWQFTPPVASAVGLCLNQSHRKSISSAWMAWREPTAERFHDWRKHAKTHWYHCSLREQAAPKNVTGHMENLEVLAETLGKERDLYTLREGLMEIGFTDGGEHAIKDVFSALDERREALRSFAKRIARSMIRWKPAPTVGRVEAFWA